MSDQLDQIANEINWPALSKYHGMHGFETERFLEDYQAALAQYRASKTRDQSPTVAALRSSLTEREAENAQLKSGLSQRVVDLMRNDAFKDEEIIKGLTAELAERDAESHALREQVEKALDEYDRIDSCSPGSPWCDDPTYGNADHYDRHPSARRRAIDAIRAALQSSTPHATETK